MSYTYVHLSYQQNTLYFQKEMAKKKMHDINGSIRKSMKKEKHSGLAFINKLAA